MSEFLTAAELAECLDLTAQFSYQLGTFSSSNTEVEKKRKPNCFGICLGGGGMPWFPATSSTKFQEAFPPSDGACDITKFWAKSGVVPALYPRIFVYSMGWDAPAHAVYTLSDQPTCEEKNDFYYTLVATSMLSQVGVAVAGVDSFILVFIKGPDMPTSMTEPAYVQEQIETIARVIKLSTKIFKDPSQNRLLTCSTVVVPFSALEPFWWMDMTTKRAATPMLIVEQAMHDSKGSITFVAPSGNTGSTVPTSLTEKVSGDGGIPIKEPATALENKYGCYPSLCKWAVSVGGTEGLLTQVGSPIFGYEANYYDMIMSSKTWNDSFGSSGGHFSKTYGEISTSNPSQSPSLPYCTQMGSDYPVNILGPYYDLNYPFDSTINIDSAKRHTPDISAFAGSAINDQTGAKLPTYQTALYFGNSGVIKTVKGTEFACARVAAMIHNLERTQRTKNLFGFTNKVLPETPLPFDFLKNLYVSKDYASIGLSRDMNGTVKDVTSGTTATWHATAAEYYYPVGRGPNGMYDLNTGIGYVRVDYMTAAKLIAAPTDEL